MYAWNCVFKLTYIIYTYLNIYQEYFNYENWMPNYKKTIELYCLISKIYLVDQNIFSEYFEALFFNIEIISYTLQILKHTHTFIYIHIH